MPHWAGEQIRVLIEPNSQIVMFITVAIDFLCSRRTNQGLPIRDREPKIRCRACSISSRLAVGRFNESMLHPQPGVRLRLVQNVLNVATPSAVGGRHGGTWARPPAKAADRLRAKARRSRSDLYPREDIGIGACSKCAFAAPVSGDINAISTLWTPVAEAAAETDGFSLAAMLVLAGLTSVNVLHDEAGVVMLLDHPMRRL